MPSSRAELDEIDKQLRDLEASVLRIGLESGDISEDEIVRNGVDKAKSGYGRKDLQYNFEGEIDDGVAQVLGELNELRSDIDSLRESAQRWRRRTWLWRIVSFLLGSVLGVLSTQLF